MDSEDRLFVLYTSGSTGKPSVLCTPQPGTTSGPISLSMDLRHQGGRRLLVHRYVGWITGHSYIVYGPLSNGATSVMYEGAPRPPNRGRSGS